MTNYENGVYIYAARYAHKRNTGAALQVVSSIVKNWDKLSIETQLQLQSEAVEDATFNLDYWDELKKLEVKG